MAKSITVSLKKRGRPATGRDPTLGARFDPATIAAIEAWAAAAGVGRSEAIRQLVDIGLKAKVKGKAR